MFSLRNMIDIVPFDPKKLTPNVMRAVWHNAGKDSVIVVSSANFSDFLKRVHQYGPPDEVVFEYKSSPKFKQGAKR